MQVNPVQISLVDFDTSMKLLAKNHRVPLKDLSPELKEAYQKVKYAVTAFHGGPSYAIVRQTIMKLVKPSTIEPETLGAYIWGCVQDCYGDAEKYCTPLCINSIPSETDEKPSCQHHIITREINDDGGINIVCLNCNRNNEQLHTAILYSREDIDSLTGQELRFIKNLGIAQLSIMIKDGYKYVQKLPMTPVDRIVSAAPTSAIPKGYVQAPMHVKDHEPEEQSNNYFSWFLIIVFIIVIALLVYFFL